MKYQVDNKAVEMVRESMEKAMVEMQTAKGKELKPAIARYLEASRAYRTMLTVKYNL